MAWSAVRPRIYAANMADTPPHELSVLVGRFQPFHDGHLSLLRQALGLAPRVVVVIGSAFQARSPKHPFTWEERANMVRRALPEEERSRVVCTPVRDYFEEARWITAVRRAVSQALADRSIGPARSTALVGHLRDATREYLHSFPEWSLKLSDGLPLRRASAMRDALFAAPEQGLRQLAHEAPAGVVDFLREWSTSPWFEPLRQEAALLRSYAASWAVAPYPPIDRELDNAIQTIVSQQMSAKEAMQQAQQNSLRALQRAGVKL